MKQIESSANGKTVIDFMTIRGVYQSMKKRAKDHARPRIGDCFQKMSVVFDDIATKDFEDFNFIMAALACGEIDHAVFWTNTMIESVNSECNGKLAIDNEDELMMDKSIRLFRKNRNSCIFALASFMRERSNEVKEMNIDAE